MRLPKLSDKVIFGEFDLLTSREMLFNNPAKKEVITYPRFTQCKKIPYKQEMLSRFNAYEKTQECTPENRCVIIELDGLVRYVSRSDVYIESEKDKAVKCDKGRLRGLRKNSKRNVDQGEA